MEVSIFPLPEVRAEKSKFVEVRLHSDTHDPKFQERIDGLIENVAKSTAQPIYVAIVPSTEKELGRFNGASIGGPAPFVEFLDAMAGEL